MTVWDLHRARRHVWGWDWTELGTVMQELHCSSLKFLISQVIVAIEEAGNDKAIPPLQTLSAST